MMLSRLTLSPWDCHNAKIRDDYSIHKIVYSLFPKQTDATRDFLYADLGDTPAGLSILILSAREPAEPKFGQLETKSINPRFLEFKRYGFQITLNAIQRSPVDGKLKPITKDPQLTEWFLRKAAENGFTPDAATLEFRDISYRTFPKGDKECTFNRVFVVGKLTVSDPVQFRAAFQNGIGRAKGFGFGLLQLVPLSS